jgi:hypothetical protein
VLFYVGGVGGGMVSRRIQWLRRDLNRSNAPEGCMSNNPQLEIRTQKRKCAN